MIHHLIVSRAMTLGECLESELQISPARTEELIYFGAIYRNKVRSTPLQVGFELSQGDYLRVHAHPRRYRLPRVSAESIIVAIEKDFIVLNKPAGIPVHSTVDNLHENLLAWFQKSQTSIFTTEKLAVTNRLDAVTEGLLIFARTSKFLSEFNKSLEKRSVEKNYECLHQGPPMNTGQYIDWIVPTHGSVQKAVAEASHPDAKKCELTVVESKVLTPEIAYSRLLLGTGRTHQIRVQLQAQNRPILGDRLYGSQILPFDEVDRVALRCHSMEFPWDGRTHRYALSDWNVYNTVQSVLN